MTNIMFSIRAARTSFVFGVIVAWTLAIIGFTSFEDGIIYYCCANIAKRSYLLFTLTPDDYMYEVVNF